MPRYIDAVALTEFLGVPEDWRDEAINRIIANATTVDVAPVVYGEWIMNENKVYHCSMCGQLRPFDDDYDYWESNYCLNCGAKMDGNK